MSFSYMIKLTARGFQQDIMLRSFKAHSDGYYYAKEDISVRNAGQVGIK